MVLIKRILFLQQNHRLFKNFFTVECWHSHLYRLTYKGHDCNLSNLLNDESHIQTVARLKVASMPSRLRISSVVMASVAKKNRDYLISTYSKLNILAKSII